MEQDLQQRLDAIEKKVDDIYVSAEKTRKYFLWTAIVTIAAIVLPLIGLAFALPSVISTYSSALGL
ncbi:MAG TPA: hypothetical protein VL426_00900 [Candidatus Binatia bacterium]|jgi:hypothetical protein|nr:hypothetical protein [Candidatus Binatia bacterium]